MSEPLLIEALSRGGPWAAAVLAAGFSLWRWILPAIKDLRETSARITAAEAERAEAARRARDEAWQGTLRETSAAHKAAVDATVTGFREALDRHEKYLDRFSAQHEKLTGQHERLAQDIGVVRQDVASLKSDVHTVVSRLALIPGKE